MSKWLKKLEQWLGGGADGAKRFNSFRWLLILGLIGVAIMLFNSFVNVKKVDPENVGREPPGVMKNEPTLETTTGEESSFAGIEKVFEDNMKQMLEQIVGVGTVDVMVTVDSTEEVIVQRNVKDMQEENNETDANGGQRHTTQYTRDGEIVTYESSGGQHTPIVTKKVKPQVRGVLVVAMGAENPTVKQLIVDAVQKGLNVPSYKISVVPRKQG
ncbi:stage III sporulation protein AG [Paenibacillus sp. SEL3]|jgi:stage III sporulation protein AG|uniref:Stage III sporulation protein AG n=1 Tax=Paenibacillus polymyxa TaxID=1406 RepID=A0A074LDP3_PAEPO|nr:MULTISPECIES: stage III sporulation protein AG [Paenibacillus]MCF2719981.1 stage III sporulation protein AG [Paenibacillus sp. UKAQ_18]AOK88794.1 stage III sporulation protein AG [Paenibacillus polymyxa]KAF6575238.1 stage III sporulation protein AG [Paenibacillus sp. EKM206P]KAF6580200.1 stage III sporulation protein AG [Paenibacillus sp. EKM212P]KAF6590089.1 stage III sporulation protein AG [Paenibacillus sp. EKM205P]